MRVSHEKVKSSLSQPAAGEIFLGVFLGKNRDFVQKSTPGGPTFQQIFERVKSSGKFLPEILKELRAREKNPGFRLLRGGS